MRLSVCVKKTKKNNEELKKLFCTVDGLGLYTTCLRVGQHVLDDPFVFQHHSTEFYHLQKHPALNPGP